MFFQFNMANWWEITDVTIRPIGISVQFSQNSETSQPNITIVEILDHLARVVHLENHPLWVYRRISRSILLNMFILTKVQSTYNLSAGTVLPH